MSKTLGERASLTSEHLETFLIFSSSFSFLIFSGSFLPSRGSSKQAPSSPSSQSLRLGKSRQRGSLGHKAANGLRLLSIQVSLFSSRLLLSGCKNLSAVARFSDSITRWGRIGRRSISGPSRLDRGRDDWKLAEEVAVR